ncbi:MAG: hypothetical protein SPG50_07910 [Muribaculaceae bacterium]|nr:hypothetical protein [Muribaculaceae bacterium]
MWLSFAIRLRPRAPCGDAWAKLRVRQPHSKKAVDMHIYLLALVLGEGRVKGGAIEVIVSDVAFERDVI